MLHHFLAIFSLFITLAATQTTWAADHECGPWTNTQKSCSYGSYNHTWRWERDCSNSSEQCGPPNNPAFEDQICDSEDICLPARRNSNQPVDPNTDFDTCTSWEKQHDVECADHDGNLVQKWIRACKRVGISTGVCSRTRPVDYPEDYYND